MYVCAVYQVNETSLEKGNKVSVCKINWKSVIIIVQIKARMSPWSKNKS